MKVSEVQLRCMFHDYNDEYFDDAQRAKISSFIEDTTASYRQSYYVSMVGAYKTADFDAIEANWVDYVTPDVDEDVEETSKGLETWQIVLIVVSGVIVLAGLVGMVVYFVLASKKKKEEEARANEVVNAYKKRIDVTDDKSVDVYSNDEEKEEVEKAVEAEETEEVVAETVEETAEEVVEEPEVVEATESVEETETQE